MSDDAYQRALAVKQAHEAELLAMPNVVGVGVGLRKKRGVLTDEVALVVMVSRKLTLEAVDSSDVIPREINGVPVDVQEVGEVKAGG